MTKEQLQNDHIKGEVDAERNDRAREDWQEEQMELLAQQAIDYGEERVS